MAPDFEVALVSSCVIIIAGILCQYLVDPQPDFTRGPYEIASLAAAAVIWIVLGIFRLLDLLRRFF